MHDAEMPMLAASTWMPMPSGIDLDADAQLS
jgi:hypothetical protein